jgi:hypothetical protein
MAPTATGVEPDPVIRMLAAIVIADVVGFSRHMERDDAGTLARLREIREQHRSQSQDLQFNECRVWVVRRSLRTATFHGATGGNGSFCDRLLFRVRSAKARP